MRYRVFMSIEIDAKDDRQAYENAVKFESLLKNPTLKFFVESEGIQLSGDGDPVVHQPFIAP